MRIESGRDRCLIGRIWGRDAEMIVENGGSCAVCRSNLPGCKLGFNCSQPGDDGLGQFF